jgi:AraC-like DNA-binding protein
MNVNQINISNLIENQKQHSTDQSMKYRFMVKVIATNLGLSRLKLYRCFKDETGENISNFIRQKRQEIAISLLEGSEYSINEIATHLGYSCASAFSRSFRNYWGVSPRGWRVEKKHNNIK